MAGEQRADLVVVGGGAMGLSTAWWAAAAADVVLLERFEPLHRRGASHGRERIFRYIYTDRVYAELALAADEGWQRLERDTRRGLIQRVGCVEHGPHFAIDAAIEVAEGLGVTTELLTAEQASHRWPAVRFESDALAQPTAGWVRAADAIESLRLLAAGRGARLRFGAQVSSIEPVHDGVRVRTSGEVFLATSVVVTAGAWTAGLLPDTWLPPLTTTEEHVFFFQARPEAQGRFPSFLHWRDVDFYGLPASNGLVKVGEHQTGSVTTGDDRTFVTDPRRIARIEEYVAEWLPGLIPAVVHATTCLFTSTPSSDFVLDRVGPVVVGGGFSGHGFKFVPEIGRRLAAMAAGDLESAAPFTLAAHASRRAAG